LKTGHANYGDGSFRRARIRITVLIASAILLLFAVTLAVVYYSTTHRIEKKNYEMMAVYAASYLENGSPGTGGVKGDMKPGGEPSDTLFYAVEYDSSGAVLSISNDAPTIHTNDELTEAAELVLEETKEYGILTTDARSFAYLRTDADDGRVLVVFMDNQIYETGEQVLLYNLIIMGCIAIVVGSLLAWIMSGKCVQPLRESYMKQRQFISDAGHELKTPVSTIGANAELLSREIGANKWLDNIVSENRRMSVLIRQMLDLTKMEQTEFVGADVDISRIVRAEVLAFEGPAFEKGVMIDAEIEDGVMVYGDESQLGQLASILIDNAVDHCPKGETVRVSLGRLSRRGAVLTVQNPGEAIAEEEREKIFERFYRSDVSRTGDGHYGLGLAIARSIVTAHKGSITAESTGGMTTLRATIDV